MNDIINQYILIPLFLSVHLQKMYTHLNTQTAYYQNQSIHSTSTLTVSQIQNQNLENQQLQQFVNNNSQIILSNQQNLNQSSSSEVRNNNQIFEESELSTMADQLTPEYVNHRIQQAIKPLTERIERVQVGLNKLKIEVQEKLEEIKNQNNRIEKILEKIIQKNLSEEEIIQKLFSKIVYTDDESFNYQQLRELGQGHSGRVMLVKQKQTNQKFALKKISQPFTILHQEVRKKLINEVKILQEIDHQNIIRLKQIFFIRQKDVSLTNYYCFVLQYGEMGNLKQFIMNNDMKVDQVEKYQIIKGILEGLVCLYRKNIIHRDIKMENIVISNVKLSKFDRIPKICDFGDAVKSNQTCSRRISLHGTYAYMSPQILAHRTYDTRTDIWSFGILVYILLYGRHPFNYDRRQPQRQYLRKITQIPLGFPEIQGTEIYRNVITKALTLDHYSRYNAQQLHAQFEKIHPLKYNLIKFEDDE